MTKIWGEKEGGERKSELSFTVTNTIKRIISHNYDDNTGTYLNKSPIEIKPQAEARHQGLLC